MRKLTGAVFLSLDGVMQAPGGPSEDYTGGFEFGGWMAALSDPAVGETVGALFGAPFDLLLGRRTYDIFAGHWPHVTGEEAGFAALLNDASKYVVTRGEQPLDWQNSHRLADIEGVATLKQSSGPDLLIQGSSTLYPQLLAAGLIDRLITMTFPVVLGSGKRLFGAGTPPVLLKPVEVKASPAGTMIATYEPAGAVPTASFAMPERSAPEALRQEKMALGTW